MKIVVCADDYGLAPGVSAGIRQALAAGRISATSVMPLPPFWPAEAASLKPYIGKADIGLHLTLTDQVPLGPMPSLAPHGRLPPLAQLLERCTKNELPLEEIRQETQRQFESFGRAMGCAPAHVDGHHYVHHLPGIREIVADAVRIHAPQAYLRSCHTDKKTIELRGLGKAKALSLNARERGYHEFLHTRGIHCNNGFSGLYDFTAEETYASAFPRFLLGMGEGTLLVCHPGHVDDALLQRDTLTSRREEELAWLLGTEYPALLKRLNISISMSCEIF